MEDIEKVSQKNNKDNSIKPKKKMKLKKLD